jgi:hypothetical protein
VDTLWSLFGKSTLPTGAIFDVLEARQSL